MGNLYAATPGQNPGVARICICICICVCVCVSVCVSYVCVYGIYVYGLYVCMCMCMYMYMYMCIYICMCVKVSAKMRVPVNHPFIDWIFHDKPSSYWGILHDCGNPHITDWIPHKWMIYEKSEKKKTWLGVPPMTLETLGNLHIWTKKWLWTLGNLQKIQPRLAATSEARHRNDHRPAGQSLRGKKARWSNHG